MDFFEKVWIFFFSPLYEQNFHWNKFPSILCTFIYFRSMSIAVSNVSHWRKLLTFPVYFFNFPLLLCVGILQVGAVCASAYAVLHSRETSYLRLVAWLRKKKKKTNTFKIVNTAVEEIFSISLLFVLMY